MRAGADKAINKEETGLLYVETESLLRPDGERNTTTRPASKLLGYCRGDVVRYFHLLILLSSHSENV